MNKVNIGVVGGGAAGFFAAIEIASSNPSYHVTILEKSDKILSKVKVSGGGRCNVSNACFDIEELIKNYPRGSKELRSVFHKFNPADTINWFESKGVNLKTENDNRVFPVSNNSETIINCFLQEAKKYNVEIIKDYPVKEIKETSTGFIVNPDSKFSVIFDKLIIATGGNSKSEFYSMFEKLGHIIIPPVPSLFTFNLDKHPLKGLEGISLEKVKLKIKSEKIFQEGAILVTHWGFSGPAILKLSAYGARKINEMNYDFYIDINWIPEIDNIKKSLSEIKSKFPNQKISSHTYFNLPIRLWKRLVELAGINEDLKWAETSKEKLLSLEKVLTENNFHIKGKTTFKEEFVTAGGISLKEIDFKTMESKICKGLYFAGEVLDIDGITGGFNFQTAWSTASIAAKGVTSI
ncbi:MAG: NAD(P)/FAD-dependent oxidoreductase [Ignavibacteriae bacterium]|nr:NAD(P)/FAD-dependent oxidoreductase [Ignavibacteriota bacterium]